MSLINLSGGADFDEWHVAERYISSVLDGSQVACRFVRLMCERHRSDLVDGADRGLRFDVAAGQHVIDFFRFLRHSKGKWAGTVIALEPWQQALLWVMFGWKREDGTRRYRTGYWEVARKNGKSTIAAGVGLYLMVADGEPGAEVYSAATKRDQARITHQEARRMVMKSPALKRRITCFRDNLHIAETATKFETLGRDADSMDGLNVHGAIVDELHAHKTDEVWGVLATATGSREQPLIFGITTAGFNQNSFCFQLREHAVKILEGVTKDDDFFAVIYTLDKGDDWTDEANWVKSNPNLGVSVRLKDLQAKVAQARSIGSALTHFLTKHMNVWTRASEIWISPDKWRLCGGVVDVAALAGRTCYAGLDLSNTQDFTAFVLVFPPVGDEDDRFVVLPRFWLPEDTITDRKKSEENLNQYETWVRNGLIEAIPGPVIDYDFIYAQIDKDAQMFDVREVAYDPWGAAEVYLRLEKEGMATVQMRQGVVTMSPAMKTLERAIVGGKLNHGNNAVLTWMAHNLVATSDAAGNLKPDKRRSREKIDGMVALLMALDRASRHEASQGRSIYERRGIRTL